MDEVYSKEERIEQIKKMRTVTEDFYTKATRTGVHAFIEFCGMMNEFINMCAATNEEGIDFNAANTHTGNKLVMKPHHAAYLAEKFDCIYGPTLVGEARQQFMEAMGWMGHDDPGDVPEREHRL